MVLLALAGCHGSAGREDSDSDARASPGALSWEWGTATDGDFMRSLQWHDPVRGASVPIVLDEPSAGIPGGCRWWPHGGNCSHWTQSYSNNSARVQQDWAWQIVIPDGHGGGPVQPKPLSRHVLILVRKCTFCLWR